jgi:hypothetical protein
MVTKSVTDECIEMKKNGNIEDTVSFSQGVNTDGFVV